MRCYHTRRDIGQEIPWYGGVGMQTVEANLEVSITLVPSTKAFGIF